MIIGQYTARVVKKGEEECFFELSEGEVFWTVQLDADSRFDVRTQFEAEVVARLVRIERSLNSLTRKVK